MKIIFTKHAEDKLKRPDIKKFAINKRLIVTIPKDPDRRLKQNTVILPLFRKSLPNILYE